MYFLKTRSGALYGAEGQSRLVVEPIHVDVDVSPLLKAAVERENACDVNELPMSACGDGYVASSLDDVDLLPDIGHYPPSTSSSADSTTSGKNAGKKRRKKAAKDREFWAKAEASVQAKSVVHDLAESPITVDTDVVRFPARKGAYGAKTSVFKNRGAKHDANSLEALGLRRIKWGGM